MSLSLSLSLSLEYRRGCSLSLSSKQGKERHDVNDESVSRSIEIVCARAKKKRERGAFFGAFCVCRFLVNAERKKKRMSHAELYN